MRILVIGAGGDHRTEASLVRAARALGHTASLIDTLGWWLRLGRWSAPLVKWQADRFAPDLALCTRHAISAGVEVLRWLLRGRASAFWYFDAVSPLPEATVTLARLTQRTFATCGFQVEAFRAAGAPEAQFLPQGMDPEIDRPVARAPARYHCDVAFVGSGQYPRRYEVLHTLGRAFRLQIRGPHWDVAPPDLPVVGGRVRGWDFARVVRGAAISLGIDALPAQRQERWGGASNRLWRVLGSGGCFLGERVEGIEAFARHGDQAFWYRTTTEAVELAGSLLADPVARYRVAQAGRAHALAHHTYAHRLERLIAGHGYTST